MTDFNTIYPLFLNTIYDYKIKQLFIDDISNAEQLLEYYLIRTVPSFTNCEKDLLNNIDIPNERFNVDLDLEEQIILSGLMVESWMEQIVNNISQMALSMSDNDFKHYSEKQNLEAKQNNLNQFKERNSQKITEYGLRHTPFAEWAVGNYGI